MKSAILYGNGLNSEVESFHAVQLAGGNPEYVHMNYLDWGKQKLRDYDFFFMTGGFSFGDDHGAGVVEGVVMSEGLGNDIYEFVDDGKAILGICNGFQTLVNMGLLPGGLNKQTKLVYKREVALTPNRCGTFRDQWVNLKVDAGVVSPFMRNIDVMEMPMRNGEGRFYADQRVIDRLERNKQIVVRYATPEWEIAKEDDLRWNPTGSMGSIAGICNPLGNVLGMMPHPECGIYPFNHPEHQKRKLELRRSGHGVPEFLNNMKLFRNIVAYN